MPRRQQSERSNPLFQVGCLLETDRDETLWEFAGADEPDTEVTRFKEPVHVITLARVWSEFEAGESASWMYLVLTPRGVGWMNEDGLRQG